MQASSDWATPLRLPCGAVLRNRFAKAAMTEGLADGNCNATERLNRLYRRWAHGGAGLLLTGNVQCDRRYLERAGNVAIDGNGGLDAYRAYAKAATENDTHCWVQINHPGRQAALGTEQYVAPSETPLYPGSSAMARGLDEGEILEIIGRFVHVATVSRDCGFTGVQIHGAHGYLVSQFLNPLVNHRTDAWGGSIENRARFLLETVRAVRAAVGADFPISVKLNSSDFQKGGMVEDESIQVARWLEECGIDLLEISGGTYESQVMIGRDEEQRTEKAASTIAREAYFLEFAAKIRPQIKVPLMLTGGFRTAETMQSALASGEVDLIGLARPLITDPELCNKLLAGDPVTAERPDEAIRVDEATRSTMNRAELRAFEIMAGTSYYYNRMAQLADGLDLPFDYDWAESLESLNQRTEAASREYLDA